MIFTRSGKHMKNMWKNPMGKAQENDLHSWLSTLNSQFTPGTYHKCDPFLGLEQIHTMLNIARARKPFESCPLPTSRWSEDLRTHTAGCRDRESCKMPPSKSCDSPVVLFGSCYFYAQPRFCPTNEKIIKYQSFAVFKNSIYKSAYPAVSRWVIPSDATFNGCEQTHGVRDVYVQPHVPTKVTKADWTKNSERSLEQCPLNLLEKETSSYG